MVGGQESFCDFWFLTMPGFEAVANAEPVDNIKVQENLGKYVTEILEQENQGQAPIKSILLECTQMPHYAAAIRQNTGLPVFDVATCANFFAQVLNRQWPMIRSSHSIKHQTLRQGFIPCLILRINATFDGTQPSMPRIQSSTYCRYCVYNLEASVAQLALVPLRHAFL